MRFEPLTDIFEDKEVMLSLLPEVLELSISFEPPVYRANERTVEGLPALSMPPIHPLPCSQSPHGFKLALTGLSKYLQVRLLKGLF